MTDIGLSPSCHVTIIHRSRPLRLFTGKVFRVNKATFIVKWLVPEGVRSVPATKYPYSAFKSMKVPEVDDYIHNYEHDTVYWGQVKGRVMVGGNIQLAMNWGAIEDTWDAEWINVLLGKYTKNKSNYDVVPADEVGNGTNKALTDHNLGLGAAPTHMFPVILAHMVRLLVRELPTDVILPLAARITRATLGARRALIMNRCKRVVDKAERVARVAEAVPDGAFLLDGWGEKRIGWSTADAVLATSPGYKVLGRNQWKPVRENAVVTWYPNPNPAHRRSPANFGGTYTEWNAWMGTVPVVPLSMEGDDFIGKLISERHLQVVELRTIASFIGSRVHMKMQQLQYTAAAPGEADAARGHVDWKKAPNGPYIPNMVDLPHEYVQAYFENTDKLDTLVEKMARSIYEVLWGDGLKLKSVASELPVADVDQLWYGNDEVRGVESRIDFLALDPKGKLILGDYKCLLGNTTYKTIAEPAQLRQLATYAWLLRTNYSIIVDELMIVYCNRAQEVTVFRTPCWGDDVASAVIRRYMGCWARGLDKRIIIDYNYVSENDNVNFSKTRAAAILKNPRVAFTDYTTARAAARAAGAMRAGVFLPLVNPNLPHKYKDDQGREATVYHVGKGVYRWENIVAQPALVHAPFRLVAPPARATPIAGKRADLNKAVQAAGEELVAIWGGRDDEVKALAHSLELPYRSNSTAVSVFIRKINRLVNTEMRGALAKGELTATADFLAFVGASRRGTWPVWQDEATFSVVLDYTNNAVAAIQQTLT